MSHIAELGIIAYAIEGSKENWDMISQAWFEGYAAAMNEVGSITDREYDEVIDALVDITKDIERR